MNTIQDSPVSTGESTTRTGSGVSASFLERFAALLLDGFIMLIVGGMLIGFGTEGIFSGYGNSVPALLSWIYSVFMTVKYGATLGKMAVKIRVQNEETGANLTFVEAILREVVGKFISGAVLFVGYLWMLWDPKKQTWHDKLGKSVVVKAK